MGHLARTKTLPFIDHGSFYPVVVEEGSYEDHAESKEGKSTLGQSFRKNVLDK